MPYHRFSIGDSVRVTLSRFENFRRIISFIKITAEVDSDIHSLYFDFYFYITFLVPLEDQVMIGMT